jgi:hypothetical protein
MSGALYIASITKYKYKEVALLYRLEGREGREARLTGPFSTPQI